MTARMSATTLTKEGVQMGEEGYVKNEDIATGKRDRELRGHEGLEKRYMRVNVDLIKGVLEEVIVNIVEKKKDEEDEERSRNSSRKEERWLRKWYKRMG